MEQIALLRATAQRLTTTPVEELPRKAGFLASSIASCRTALCESASKSGDNSVSLHKLITRISSLLHDKTPAGRITAAILIKSYIETAPPNAVQWESWTRNLIACLSRQDPWQAKRVYATTIVRIFSLCQQSPQLQREVSVPLVPAFVTATLSIIRPHTKSTESGIKTTTSSALPFVLHSWDEVLQIYGNTLRPFVSRIKPICLSVLSETNHAPQLQDLASQVLASLHRCVPKNVSVTEWDGAVSNLVKAAHNTLDHVFRAVLEDWASNDAFHQKLSVRYDYSKPPGIEQIDAAELWPWRGIYSGILRVVNLLRWMERMLDCGYQQATIPIGRLLDLLARIMSVTIPELSSVAQYSLRLNSEVGKEEREELWSNLPQLHASCIGLCDTLLIRFGQSIFPALPRLVNQILDLYDAEKWSSIVRSASYRFMASLLRLNGSVCMQLNRQYFQALCKSCYIDVKAILLPDVESENSNVDTIRGGPNGISSASKVTPGLNTVDSPANIPSPLFNEALSLMVALLDQAAALPLASSTRAEMDRLAILSRNESALLGSVMNPAVPRSGQLRVPSLIPFLGRNSVSVSLAVDNLIRPRMPPLSAVVRHANMEREVENEEEHPAVNERNEEYPTNHKLGGEEAEESAQTVHDQNLNMHRTDPKISEVVATDRAGSDKRAFESVDDAENMAGSDSYLHSSKKPRTDFSEISTSQTTAQFENLQASLPEPHVMKGGEGITTVWETHVEMNPKPAESALFGTAGDGDDSDESEIPPINAQLAEYLMDEDDEDEDEGEEAAAEEAD